MKKYSYLLLIFLSVYFTGCEKDETITELEEVTLSVSPENLNFDENNPSNNQITIISNVSWSINVSNNALKVDQKRRRARRKQSFCNRYSRRRNLYAYDLYRKKKRDR